MTTLNATAAREDFLNLVDRVDEEGLEVAISKHGRTKALLISPQLLESYEETIEVLSDPHLLKAVREGQKDKLEGKVIRLEDFRRSLSR